MQNNDLIAARAEAARLREALKPFAKWHDACCAMARFSGGSVPKPQTVITAIHGAHPAEIRWRDFAGARAALEGDRP